MAARSISKTVTLILLYSLSYNCCNGGELPKQSSYYRAELIHRESPLSPLVNVENLTAPQRVRRSLERSHRRLEWLHALATGRAPQFYSPVSPGGGAFLMQIRIGTPTPLLQHMSLDTGSDLIWLQCGPCVSCYKQPDALYNPHTSSSYRNVSCNNKICTALEYSSRCGHGDKCEYFYTYGDGSSTTGIIGSETFSLKTSPSASSGWGAIPGIAFGCGNQQLGNFGGATGLVGLGRGKISLVSQMGETIKHKFSYCLGSVQNDSAVSPLFLGDAPISDLSSNFQSTPFIGVNDPSYVPTFYYLSLHGISVGGTTIKYPASTFAVHSEGDGGFIIDSGTTVTYLADPAYKPFLAAVKSRIRAKHVNASSTGGTDLCYRSTLPVPNFPDIAFHFEGNATFIVPPRNSFLLLKDDLGRELLCFAYSSAGPQGSMSVFGNTQQQNFNIIYDMGKNKLSFAPADCDNL